MEYPKAIMKIAELVKLGFPKELLYQYSHSRESTAKKMSNAPNSPILIITKDFEVWRKRVGRI